MFFFFFFFLNCVVFIVFTVLCGKKFGVRVFFFGIIFLGVGACVLGVTSTYKLCKKISLLKK